MKKETFGSLFFAFCGSWLACDAGNSVYLQESVDAIAGKPAPTFDRDHLKNV
ncbi:MULTISPECIES: hypothetical protein [unclassified Pseudomonas]|uniref:hypothetical protein n=1 Tax=unclassified Pseudomonas TaxID=196821 RepID=UPI0030D71A64